MPIVGIVLTAYLRRLYAKFDAQEKRIKELSEAAARKDGRIRRIEHYAARLAGRQDAYVKHVAELRSEVATLTSHNNDLARLLMVARERISELQRLHVNERTAHQKEIGLLNSRIAALEGERSRNRLEIQRLTAALYKALGLDPVAANVPPNIIRKLP